VCHGQCLLYRLLALVDSLADPAEAYKLTAPGYRKTAMQHSIDCAQLEFQIQRYRIKREQYRIQLKTSRGSNCHASCYATLSTSKEDDADVYGWDELCYTS